MAPVRRLLRRLEEIETSQGGGRVPQRGKWACEPATGRRVARHPACLSVCLSHLHSSLSVGFCCGCGAFPTGRLDGWSGAPDVDELIGCELVTPEDVAAALGTTNPSATMFADKYDAWQREFGSE
jgi:hypothetical protein